MARTINAEIYLDVEDRNTPLAPIVTALENGFEALESLHRGALYSVSITEEPVFHRIRVQLFVKPEDKLARDYVEELIEAALDIGLKSERLTAPVDRSMIEQGSSGYTYA